MLKSLNGGLRAVPFPIDDPERIPVQRYYDAEFYQAELDHLWSQSWQMACRLEQIPDEGDWIEYQNVGKSILVVNTKDGVKAFHNACRHRGVAVQCRRYSRLLGLREDKGIRGWSANGLFWSGSFVRRSAARWERAGH